MSDSDSDFDPLFGDEEVPKEARGFVPDLVRKVAVAGLGALFMTEEGIRNLASQLKIPKDAATYIFSQAEKTKDDVARMLSEELRRFFQSEKLRAEFLKVLTGMTVEVTAQVRLVPKEERKDAPPAASPEVKVTRISAKRGKR